MPLQAWQNMANTYRAHTSLLKVDAIRRSVSESVEAQRASRQTKASGNQLAKYAYAQYAKTSALAAASIIRTAGSLRMAADTFGSANGPLQKRIAYSSSPAAVASVKDNTALGSRKLDIKQLAASQTNSGASLVKQAPSAIAAGISTLRLQFADGNAQSVNVSIHPNDTNAQALSKVRSAINSSAAGVTASIADNEQAGTAALILLSKDSGTNQGFTLSDISGNMVAATGIGTISQEAADVLYTLDGGAEQSSQSNELTLDDGKLSILLKQTDKEVMITVTPDEEAIGQDVRRLIGGYNVTVDAIRQAGSYVQGGLARRLQSAAADSLPQLELLGIIHRNGMLSLDENKLTSSTLTHFSAVERSLGSSSGIASKLGKAAGQLQELTPETLLDPHSSLFQEYANYSFVQQSLHTYLPVPLTGLLLNSYM